MVVWAILKIIIIWWWWSMLIIAKWWCLVMLSTDPFTNDIQEGLRSCTLYCWWSYWLQPRSNAENMESMSFASLLNPKDMLVTHVDVLLFSLFSGNGESCRQRTLQSYWHLQLHHKEDEEPSGDRHNCACLQSRYADYWIDTKWNQEMDPWCEAHKGIHWMMYCCNPKFKVYFPRMYYDAETLSNKWTFAVPKGILYCIVKLRNGMRDQFCRKRDLHTLECILWWRWTK